MAFSSRLFSVVILFCVAAASVTKAAPTTSAAPALLATTQVRVRTHHNFKKIRVSGFGIRINGHKIVDSNLPTLSKFNVRVAAGDDWIVELSKPYKANSSELLITGEMLRVENAPEADRVVLSHQKHSHFDVISELPLDEYLKGVVPSEMPARWPIEALKAQVVASRSYALNEISAHDGEAFHLDDSIMHQVFNWSKYLGASVEEQEKINRVIRETQNEVLTDDNGRPLKAYFHSDCGGRTEEASAVWGHSDKLGTVSDKHCSLNRKSEWREAMSSEELGRELSKYFDLPDTMALNNIAVKSRSASGRAHILNIAFNDANGTDAHYEISAQKLRQLVGFTRIKSTNFSVTFADGSYAFVGRGNGHGVGLCQQGSRFMAAAGESYRAILKRYYPRARLNAKNP